jgi:hypothetical protein
MKWLDLLPKPFALAGLLGLFLTAQPFSVHLPLIFGPGTTATPTATLRPTAPATVTPTPTATVTPTPTPSATPTAAVVILSHSTYTNALGMRSIVGEIQNQDSRHVRFVRVTADLFDAKDQLLATDFTYTERSIVADTERSCFKITFWDPPQDFDHYTLRVEAQQTTEEPRLLILSEVSEGTNPVDFELIGQIRNGGQTDTELAKIVGTLYDSDSVVIGCDSAFADQPSLAPGEVGSWRLAFAGVDRARIAFFIVLTD